MIEGVAEDNSKYFSSGFPMPEKQEKGGKNFLQRKSSKQCKLASPAKRVARTDFFQLLDVKVQSARQSEKGRDLGWFRRGRITRRLAKHSPPRFKPQT